MKNKNFIEAYRKYIFSLNKWDFLIYKFIYFKPQKKMYYIYDDINHELFQYQIKILAISDIMQYNNNILDFIINMFYFNPLLVDFNEEKCSIELLKKDTHKPFFRVANNVFALLNFQYGKLVEPNVIVLEG